jgi:hypothetical protein
MTTRLTGSKEESSCVTQAGFRYNGRGADALPCTNDTYNPGFNRLAQCYNCPAGLSAGTGADSKADCSK